MRDGFTDLFGRAGTGLRSEVREEHDRYRSPLGSAQLFVKSNDILEGSLGGRIVDEKDTLGPSQVPEEASVSYEPAKLTLTHNSP
jgi:hypothetical protein